MGIFDGSHNKNVTHSDIIPLGSYGWDVKKNRIVNVKDPVVSQDVVTLAYLIDNYLNKTGGSIQGDINMNNNMITNLDLPTNPRDCCPVEFVNYRINDVMQSVLDGSVPMTGNLNMDNNSINNLPNQPENNNSATSKYYVDTSISNLKSQITSKKYISIHAEENGNLTDGNVEYSFGNGTEQNQNYGFPMPTYGKKISYSICATAGSNTAGQITACLLINGTQNTNIKSSSLTMYIVLQAIFKHL